MALLIIDGYNLIGTQHGSLHSERESLIEMLINYRRRTGHDITLVFDGYIDGGHESSSVRGGVRVTYTGIGERADSAIIRMLPQGQEAVVISSDREVQSGAWAADAVAVDSESFIRRLESYGRHAEDFGGYEDDEDELYVTQQKRGNPRKLSKKQKAVQRVLRKL